MRLSKKLAIAAVSTVAAVSVATGAFAYWSSTGNGSGSGSAGTSSSWAVTSDPAIGGPLTPGGPSQTVAYHVTNNSSGYQKLLGMNVAVKNADGNDWTAVTGCSAADFSVNIVGFAASDLAPGATYTGSASISMNDLSTNQNACKSVSVPLYFSAS